MSMLLNIRKQLDIAGSRITDLEKALRTYPDEPAIAANLDAAVRIRKKLELQFMEAAASIGVEVCRYRAFDYRGRSRVADAFLAIAYFQKAVSVVFGAKKNGRKAKATTTEQEETESAFGFGFAFTGSIGVVLTVPNDTPLLEGSLVDDAIDAIFEMAKARTPQEINRYVDELGPGSISALYQWVDANVDKKLGAEIEWRRGDLVKSSLLIQREELAKLRTAIEATSSEKVDVIDVTGDLLMADVTNHRFKIRDSALRMIKGSVELGAIDQQHTVLLPKRYKAKLRKTTKTHRATGIKEVNYHLLQLQEAV